MEVTIRIRDLGQPPNVCNCICEQYISLTPFTGEHQRGEVRNRQRGNLVVTTWRASCPHLQLPPLSVGEAKMGVNNRCHVLSASAGTITSWQVSTRQMVTTMSEWSATSSIGRSILLNFFSDCDICLCVHQIHLLVSGGLLCTSSQPVPAAIERGCRRHSGSTRSDCRIQLPSTLRNPSGHPRCCSQLRLHITTC